MSTKLISVIPGDGIGPEVVAATLDIIRAAKIPVEFEQVEAGAKAFARGIASGVPKETADSISRTRVALKGPLETPIGYGNKSANVTLRNMFETFGNIRPVRELPCVVTPFSGRKLDFVVVRENVEDLYTGIEYMQTPGVAECLKITSRHGCEKIVRLAFELAVAEGRKRVHCATKANIMKLTEGMLKHAFDDIAKEYPQIEARQILVDNCAHQLAMRPEQFDIIVTTNMNGDILSDLTSGLTGGLGFAPSANIGNEVAIFEAVHGSAPDIAGKNLANPTALILSASMLLRHIGFGGAANEIEQAVLVTLESGIRTGDMKGEGPAASTTEFRDRVIANLGKRSKHTVSREAKPLKLPPRAPNVVARPVSERSVVGVDVFLESTETAEALANELNVVTEQSPLVLYAIMNRGSLVYPAAEGPVESVDHYRCRFMGRGEGNAVTDVDILNLVAAIGKQHRWMHIEKLQRFDGTEGFTKTQGR
jgi:isocitrate dehydrogenase